MLPGMANNFVNLAIENAMELLKAVTIYDRKIAYQSNNHHDVVASVQTVSSNVLNVESAAAVLVKEIKCSSNHDEPKESCENRAKNVNNITSLKDHIAIPLSKLSEDNCKVNDTGLNTHNTCDISLNDSASEYLSSTIKGECETAQCIEKIAVTGEIPGSKDSTLTNHPNDEQKCETEKILITAEASITHIENEESPCKLKNTNKNALTVVNDNQCSENRQVDVKSKKKKKGKQRDLANASNEKLKPRKAEKLTKTKKNRKCTEEAHTDIIEKTSIVDFKDNINDTHELHMKDSHNVADCLNFEDAGDDNEEITDDWEANWTENGECLDEETRNEVRILGANSSAG